MFRKAVLLLLALLLTAAVSLRPCCTVTVGGRELSGSWSPACAERAIRLASLAAEELCGAKARLPETEMRQALRLSRPENDVPALTDAILRSTGGVQTVRAVYVDGLRIGAVPEECDIAGLLRRSIDAQMPNAAVSGKYSGEILIRTQYTGDSPLTFPNDMVLLVSGMAPVMYYTARGELA